ncbi:MAG: hypothetical protein JST67_03240 [Bacteroidetes bacterium]|nr:hypothetical protein [Bacteroidota bacterium]
MIFLTYNDSYSGIFQSQVIDVCAFLEKEFQQKTTLVAFVSIRNYNAQKKAIQKKYARSVVLPMFPKVKFWKWNVPILFFTCLLLGERKIWARGVFATNLALYVKKTAWVQKVLFDARGAYQAEFTEYQVVADASVVAAIEKIEKKALQKSNAQAAVSKQLINWWARKYQYTPKQPIVIPCTLSHFFYGNFITESQWLDNRSVQGFSKDDVVVIYSGSSAGWQSFDLVDAYLHQLFSYTEKMKLIFLSNKIPENSLTFKDFSNKIITKWVKPNEVRDLMLLADYGILIREQSVTNQVASPVKFAEYLACGLQVLISKGIGDFPDFVKTHQCGHLFSDVKKLSTVPYIQKEKNNQLVKQYFLKESTENKNKYKQIIELI